MTSMISPETESSTLEERIDRAMQNGNQSVVAKNLQDSASLMKLTDAENRHLIRIVNDSVTNYQDFDPFSCVFPYYSNNTIGRRVIATRLTVAPERALVEDDIYEEIEFLRHKIKGGYRKEREKDTWHKKFPPIIGHNMSVDNNGQELGPKQDSTWNGQIGVNTALDYILQFYRASLEARTMNERDYQGLKDGTCLFHRLIRRLKMIDEKQGGELWSLKQTWMKDEKNYSKFVNDYDNAQKRFDNLVQCAMNDFIYQFTRVYGKTPYQKLQEMKTKIEPLAHRHLDRSRRWNIKYRHL